MGFIQPIQHLGIVPFDDDKNIMYSMDYCGPKNKYPLIESCSDTLIDNDRMKEDFAKSCADKKSCTFNMVNYVQRVSNVAFVAKCGMDKKLTTIYAQHKCNFSAE